MTSANKTGNRLRFLRFRVFGLDPLVEVMRVSPVIDGGVFGPPDDFEVDGANKFPPYPIRVISRVI
jgi:hypothetical protein